LLFEEFDCEIRDKKGSENLVADHLSKILYDGECDSSISQCCPTEQLYMFSTLILGMLTL